MEALQVGQWYSLPGVDDVLIGLITRDEFLSYPEWITQRNTRNRIKKKGVIDHLRKLFPTHHVVALGELTEDDVWEDGTQYDAGQGWRLDANSRGLVWQEGLSDRVPENVLAVKYRDKTLTGLRSIYWAFDNPTAAEIAAEVVTGCMKSLKLLPKTKKFKEGQFVTALSYTCMWDNATSYGERGLWSDTDNDNITQSEYKRMKTLEAVYEYRETIKAVDALLDRTGYNKQFDQTFLTALFLFHLKYGPFDDKVQMLCSLIAETALDEDGDVIPVPVASKGKLNAASWIVRENNTPSRIPNRGKIDGFYEGVPFFCYWLTIASEQGLKHKQNEGPKVGYRKWFDNTFMKRKNHLDLVAELTTTTES